MRILIAAMALTALGGCGVGSKFSPRPVGVGTNANSLKRAPCAGCDKVRTMPGLPGWLDQKAIG